MMSREWKIKAFISCNIITRHFYLVSEASHHYTYMLQVKRNNLVFTNSEVTPLMTWNFQLGQVKYYHNFVLLTNPSQLILVKYFQAKLTINTKQTPTSANYVTFIRVDEIIVFVYERNVK